MRWRAKPRPHQDVASPFFYRLFMLYPHNSYDCACVTYSNEDRVLLRFVDGRPVSSVTIAFLEWLCEQVAASDKQVLVLIWDNAS